jgi:hypothetical protein
MTNHKKTFIPKIVSIDCRDHFANKYPALFDKRAQPRFLRLFEYILFGLFLDEETEQLVISQKILAELEIKLDIYEEDWRKYNAREYLDKFSEYLPAFKYSNNYSDGHPRQIIDRGLDEEDYEILLKEPEKMSNNNFAKCYFRSGKLRSRRDKVAKREELLIIDPPNENLLDDQKLVINYMNSIPVNTYSYLYNKNIGETIKLFNSMRMDQNKRMANAAILAAMEQNPKPIYGADVNVNTVRIYSQDQSFLNLKRELRKKYLIGTYTADLKSSHFRIIAELLKAPICLKFIEDDKDLWKEISLFVRGVENYTEAEKSIMKEVFYAISYGKKINSWFNIKTSKLELGLRDILKKINFERMLEMPIIQELLELRGKEYAKIAKDGYIIDAYDRRIEMNGKRRGAMFAERVQSYEFAIIANVFRMPLEKLGIKIICFLHDGFSFTLRDPKKYEHKLEELFNDAIKETADKWNVRSRFKVEYNG